MEKDTMIRFLVKSTIPEKKKNDDIYNCVWRAHRDVLTGRFYFKNYLKKSKTIIDDLYKMIKEYKEPLYSEYLIEELAKRYKNVEFGAIQKIVNMSLKYLLILKEYCGFEKNIDESKCDCPIDSHILNELATINYNFTVDNDILIKLKNHEIKWTAKDFNSEIYTKLQDIISKTPEAVNGNINFDFKKW